MNSEYDSDNTESEESQRGFDPIRSSSISPEFRHLASSAAVFHPSERGKYLKPVIPVGKTRFRLLDKENRPLGGAQLRVSVLKGDEVVEERRVTAGPTGYATTEFRVPADDGTKIKVEPIVDGAATEEASRVFEVPREGQKGAEVVRFDNAGDLVLPEVPHFDHGGLLLPPDLEDVVSAPELFNPSIIEQNGTCALDFNASVETRQFYFNQIVRKGSPELTREERKEINEPISFDLGAGPEPELPELIEGPTQAASPTLGKLNIYKQSWTRVGHGIGSLLYSLALAPCEETKIAIIEWSREERGRRRERARVSEHLEHKLRRDRMIEESVEGAVDEVQEGGSSTSQFGGGLTGGLAGSIGKSATGSLGISLGGSAAQSESYSEGHRQITVDTLHSLRDSVVQRSSLLRSRRSMVVTQSQQVENENIRTRIVRNRNRNHAMTIEYFQVLEHYNVQTELERQVDVLLVPYRVPSFLWNETPSFDAFVPEARDLRRRLSKLGEKAGAQVAEFSTNLSSQDEQRLKEVVRDSVDSAVDAVLPDDGIIVGLDEPDEQVANEAWYSVYNWAKGPEGTPLIEPEIHHDRDLNEDDFRRVIVSSYNNLGGFPDPRKRFNLIRWIDQYADDLRELLPPEHHAGIEALYRLVHTPEIYESENPTATASRWTVEMRQGWRPGVSLIAHTGDGQEVSLQHESDREGSAISAFSSPPIDIQAVERFEVVYAPEKAKTNVIREVADEFGVVGETVEAIWSAFSGPVKQAAEEQLEKMKEYKLKRLRITGHTDPSKYLSGTKSYELLEVPDAGETLTANNPSWPHNTTQTANIDFDLTETRRYRDYKEVEDLITHIKANRLPYLRALWLREDADRRALRLESYAHKYFPEDEDSRQVPILQLIENRPVGVMGNSVAFPLQEQGQPQRLQEDYQGSSLSLEETQMKRLISLPTRGVYAETLLSKCNATEVRDVNRMIDPEQRCQASAPDITGISPGSRQADMDLQPAQMPNPVVNIQNPPSAPQPTGTGGALELLASGDIFRDMSLGSETVSAAQALAKQAMQESGESQQSALQELSETLEQAEREAKSEAEKQAVETAKQGVEAAKERAQQRANEAFWNTDPTELRDREQVINESDMEESAKARARERNYNAVASGPGGPVPKAAVKVTEGVSESVEDFARTLSYLDISESDFRPRQDAYFTRLKKLFVYHGIASESDAVDPFRFGSLVREFQKQEGLTEDGILGEDTLWALNRPWAAENHLGVDTFDADRWSPPGEEPADQWGLGQTELRQDAGDAYVQLHSAMQNHGASLTSGGGLRALTSDTGGRSEESFHYPGLAFDLALPSGMGISGGAEIDNEAFVVEREEGGLWRVWAKTEEGTERTIDAVVWGNGRPQTQQTTQRVIDFTALARRHGFMPIPPRSGWPDDYRAAEWWHFQYSVGAIPYISQFGAEIIRAIGQTAVSDAVANDADAQTVWNHKKTIRKPGKHWG